MSQFFSLAINPCVFWYKNVDTGGIHDYATAGAGRTPVSGAKGWNTSLRCNHEQDEEAAVLRLVGLCVGGRDFLPVVIRHAPEERAAA